MGIRWGDEGRGPGIPPCDTPTEEIIMAVCETCGNDYDMAFEVHAHRLRREIAATGYAGTLCTF